MNFMSSVYDKAVQTLSPRAATFHYWGRGANINVDSEVNIK